MAEVLFLVPSNSDVALQMINTCVVECNNSSENDYQRVAYYLSALSCLFPGLGALSKELLAESGYRVVEVKDTELGQHAIELQPWIDISTAMAVFGQLALTLYKNVDERSYNNYFQIHKNHFNQTHQVQMSRILRYLYALDDEETLPNQISYVMNEEQNLQGTGPEPAPNP